MKSIQLQNLKAYREAKGWSQDMLATLSGVSKRTIQRIESGCGASIESAKSLASTFGMDSYLQLSAQGGGAADVVMKGSDDSMSFSDFANKAMRTPLFWVNVVFMLLCTLVVPDFYFDLMLVQDGMSSIMFAFILLAVPALSIESRNGLAVFYFGNLWFVAVVAWASSQPTSGWGTFFYTDSQIERFQHIEDIEQMSADIFEQEHFSSFNYEELSIDNLLKPNVFNQEGAGMTAVVNQNGQVKIEIDDKSVCQAVNARLHNIEQSAEVPACDSEQAQDVSCCMG